MTVSSIVSRWQYTGNASTTNFAYTNKIFSDTDLEVYLDSVLQTLTTHYTVSNAGEPSGGNVEFLTAPGAGVVVLIVRAIARTQGIDYVENDPFPAETTEDGMDRAMIVAQEQDTALARRLGIADTDDFGTGGDLEIPVLATRKGNVLGFNLTTGDPEMAAVSGFGTLPSPTALTGLNMLRVNAGSTAYEEQTPTQVAASVMGLAADGAVGTPGIAFASDPDTGVFLASSGDMRTAVGGLDLIRYVVGGVEGNPTSGATADFKWNGDTVPWLVHFDVSADTATFLGTVDMSGATVTLANDAISGDKVEGGTIAAITITAATINGGVITGITDLAVADGGTGASTAAAAATNLGLGTADSPQFTGIELGHASDTTLTRNSAGDVDIEGNAIYRAGGTDVPVADGGTGSSTAAGAATNLGLGTADSPQFTGIELGHASDTTLTRNSAGDVDIEGNAIYRAGGTDVPVADGGTGSSTAAAARTALGIDNAWVLIESQTTGTSAAMEFTTGIDSTHDDYEFVFLGVQGVNDGAHVVVEVSDDAGSSWKQGATDYEANIQAMNSNSTSFSSRTQTQGIAAPQVFNTISNDTDEGVSGTVKFREPSVADFHFFQSDGQHMNNSATALLVRDIGSVVYNGSVVAIDGVRFKMNSGNIKGTISLCARKKS